ncbi:MAG: GDP-mannose 4,6-dehydratase [Sulfuricurvum sp.]
MFPSKKVLITGIDGFTGNHLAAYLEKKGMLVYGTTITPSPASNHYQCDLREYDQIVEIVEVVIPDYVVHLAAISFSAETDRTLIYDTNIIGTENLLKALHNSSYVPQKIIIASSASVYGNQEIFELHENLCPQPVNHYGVSKLAMEHIVQTYFDKLNILIVRPFNYTGPGQGLHFLIPKIVEHYKQKFPTIKLGNLDVAREFNDIRFVVDTYYQLMMIPNISDIVNLCTGITWKLTDILNLMNDISNHKLHISISPELCRPNEIKVLNGSPSKLFSLITPDLRYSMNDTLSSIYNDNNIC